jgi:hypothetical protein
MNHPLYPAGQLPVFTSLAVGGGEGVEDPALAGAIASYPR